MRGVVQGRALFALRPFRSGALLFRERPLVALALPVPVTAAPAGTAPTRGHGPVPACDHCLGAHPAVYKVLASCCVAVVVSERVIVRYMYMFVLFV